MREIRIRGTEVRHDVELSVQSRHLEDIVKEGTLDWYSMHVGLRRAFLKNIGLGSYDEPLYLDDDSNWICFNSFDHKCIIRPATLNEKIFSESMNAVSNAFVVAKLEGVSVG